MIDVSMAGASITIKASGLKSNPITEFSDEGTPIDVPALEVAAGSMNLNGNLVTWTKPAPVQISFTLIPGSESDNDLRSFLRAVHVGGKGKTVGNAYIESMVISVPIAASNSATNKKTYKSYDFKNGRLLSGLPAFGSNSEGKASPSTYTFMFEGV